MKRNFLLTVLGALGMALGITSCNKCQTCSGFGYSEEICKKDFDSKSDYNDAISYIESYGFNCK